MAFTLMQNAENFSKLEGNGLGVRATQFAISLKMKKYQTSSLALSLTKMETVELWFKSPSMLLLPIHTKQIDPQLDIRFFVAVSSTL